MGACATKPLVIVSKAPEDIHEEYSTPRSAEVPVPVSVPTSTETVAIAEEVVKPVEVVEEKNVEEKPVEVSDSKPTTAPVEQKFDSIATVPEEEPIKEKEGVKLDVAEVDSIEELKSQNRNACASSKKQST